jgi:hypothetical protein
VAGGSIFYSYAQEFYHKGEEGNTKEGRNQGIWSFVYPVRRPYGLVVNILPFVVNRFVQKLRFLNKSA